ncbi:hypothetical protein [Acidicapsa ligni]|uniref:hypothetical protein n=1 Tax=Acidicapsa ligni TaxID=542300 RepID=UPI0021E005BD|nr:hypothetical protein [Acidicapsa ligni]
MKRILFPLLLLTTLPALSQQTQQSQRGLILNDSGVFVFEPANDAGCEEKIVRASFNRPAQLILVAASDRHSAADKRSAAVPTLTVHVTNQSTKPVRAVELLARFKVKDSPYQLDSTIRELPLHLSIGEGSQQLALAESVLGFESLSIEQVTYADGTTWKPAQHTCSYHPTPSPSLVAR